MLVSKRSPASRQTNRVFLCSTESRALPGSHYPQYGGIFIRHSANLGQCDSATHFDAVFLRPPLAQRHHEIWRETHLLELPLPIVFDVFVIIASRHHVALSFVNRSGLQVTKAGAPIALQVDDMIVNELLHEGNSTRSCLTAGRWRLASRQIPEECVQLGPASGFPQMPKIQHPVLSEEGGNVSEFPFVDVLVV